MRVRDLIEALQLCDPDAQVGVHCFFKKSTWDHGWVDKWVHTDIAVRVNGIGAMAEVMIYRTDDQGPTFEAPGYIP